MAAAQMTCSRAKQAIQIRLLAPIPGSLCCLLSMALVFFVRFLEHMAWLCLQRDHCHPSNICSRDPVMLAEVQRLELRTTTTTMIVYAILGDSFSPQL